MARTGVFCFQDAGRRSVGFYVQHVLCPNGVLWAVTYELRVDRNHPSAGTRRDQWFQAAEATLVEAVWFHALEAYEASKLPAAERPDLWFWLWEGAAEAP